MNNLNAMTDHQLVVLYEEGNDKAFDVMLERYRDYVYSYILFLVRDEERANDIFQDTFTRAIIAIRSHKYQTNGKLGAWLIRIAHNLVVDRSRECDNNNITCQDEFSQGILNNIRFSEATREDEIIADQELGAVRRLLDYLPAAQREIVIMHFFEDRPFKEIAELTGVSINTSLGRMRYALINLRKIIQEKNLSLVV